MLNAKIVLLLCHHNADPDAICSAFGLQSLLTKRRPTLRVEIGAAHGISRLSKHLLQFIPIHVNDQPDVANAQAIILLDTNTVQQLNNLAEKVKTSHVPIIVIDHHAAHPDTEKLATLCITNEGASSTCELVYGFYNEEGVKPGVDEAKAMFLGIAFDSRHFVLANSTTLKNVAGLIDSGITVQDILPLLSLPMDFSERVARLKASRRVKLFRIKDWILAFSHVSAYQASAARALVDLGADVAVIAGGRNGNVEVSLRATREFNNQTGIHLGKEIAYPLGASLQGMGGGHTTAAGANGTGDAEATLKKCYLLLKEKLVN